MNTELITPQEEQRLTELEQQIESNVAMVGRALFEIRESRLYRITHSTFEEYCKERFAMGKNYIDKQIRAAEVISNLGTIVPIPKNEFQARPLAKLPADQQPAAWEKAQEKAKEEGKPVAARHVEEAVSEIMPPKEKAAPSPPTDEPEPLVMDESKRRSPIKVVESEGMNIWRIAKSHLDRINKNDEFREKALNECAAYCKTRLDNKK
jgi:hypothetical protein